MDPVVNLGEIGALFGSAAYFTHLTINGITLAFPKRPSWVAFTGAIGLGIIFTLLLTIASGVAFSNQVTMQAVAQVILVGIASGGAAAGTAVTQTSAEAKRQRENNPPASEPDISASVAQPNAPGTQATTAPSLSHKGATAG